MESLEKLDDPLKVTHVYILTIHFAVLLLCVTVEHVKVSFFKFIFFHRESAGSQM